MHTGIGTHWPAVLCTEVMHTCVHQPPCIWSLQICYMHMCIKSVYMCMNLSGHMPPHTSWMHAYWDGHILACSVVYRGYAQMCASASMHLEPTTCYMHACIKSVYMHMNVSRHVLSHASWMHGHTLACSVVHE